MVLSGQNGAQGDLRLVAEEFTKIVPVPVVVRSDPELVHGTFPGDHAGRYELSQLLYIRPDLVDMARLDRVSSDPLGRFAQNPDAHEATAEYGKQVIEAQIARGPRARRPGRHRAARPADPIVRRRGAGLGRDREAPVILGQLRLGLRLKP